VALKVFLPPAGSERRFLDYMVHEAKALQHVAAAPAVVRLLDHGLWLGRPALALEWLDGQTLSHLIASERALPLPRVEEIMRQLLRAVTSLHAHGVVHADLNAANVMLCPQGSVERVRLLDFGAAHVNGVGVVARDEIIGTPGYVAPELADGARVSPTTDVYALGVLLFEMLTGQPPFPGTELLDVMYRQTRGRIPRPSVVRGGPPEVSESLDALVATALAPSPSRRFPDVSLMRAAFEEAILVTARSTYDSGHAPTDTVDTPTLRCRRRAAVPSAT
jgi:serine/threonine protein kinase